MKRICNFPIILRLLIILIIGLGMPLSANAQLPVATQIANEMTIGWNIGNSLEVPDGETAWGNPMVTQQLIDVVYDAGFNTIRIPCAWNSHADQATLEIDTSWLARVKEVVDYGYAHKMYVVLNSHWDNGWLEENPFYSMQAEVNKKQSTYWTQIANYFKDYDEHLLFAGTNEVHADYNDPTAEYIEVQQSYLQTFVDAVRATGGNNASRTLIVQTYNTNIWHGLDYFSLPGDTISDRLMVEVHHYDPYDFTLNTNNTCIYWGSPYPSQSACSWAQESYIDDLFSRVSAQWTSKGIPVIMGEYGVIKRTSLNDPDAIASREYWLKYNTAVAKKNGVIPIYWDNGYAGDNGLALFNRDTGAIVDQGGLEALMEGAGTGTSDPSQTYTLTVTTNGSGSVDLNPSGGSYSGGTIVQATASPSAGWKFTGWSGDFEGDDNPASIYINANKIITATFIEEGTDEEEDTDEEESTSGSCGNPESIELPFVQEGPGQYCWVMTTEIAYINSWALNELTINGVDYNNTWSNSLPPAENGQWIIYYDGSYDWSHFEAISAKSAAAAER